MSHFKGYIITNNKSPMVGETFKNKTSDELRSFDEVKNLTDYAGIIEDGYVIVDVDDEEQSNILFNIVKDLKLDTTVYKTTRGMHFYFKVNDRTLTNKVNTFVAIGLKVDMKLGSRNSYVCLKHQGVEREIIYETDDIQEIPLWLSPISYTFPFLTMEKGDGRNQSLFNYILILQSNEYSKSEARETLNLINKYVLEDPLQESELQTLMRDEAFNKPVFFGGKNGTTFLFDRFAKFLISEHNIIKINNQMHIYRDGIYIDGGYEIENQMIQHIPTLKQAQRTEVLRYLNILIRDNTKPSPAHYIAFNNGVYDLIEDKFMDFSDDIIITNKVPWNYNPSSYSELADKTLTKLACGDEEIRYLMEEAIGYTFYRRNEMGKAFILTGDKSNGKSTYLQMVNNLLGQENISSLDLNELGDRFKTAELFGKLANIGDDIGAEFIRDTSTFKKLVTGNPVNVERKGQDPFNMENYSKLLFSANDIPRMRDRTGAVLRRLIIIPFNATFSPDDEDYDPFIRYKLESPEVMEYLINLGLQGLKRVLISNKFTESTKVEEQLKEYEIENNPIKLFFKETGIEGIKDQSTKKVFGKYQEFCVVNNLQAMSRIAFTSAVTQELGLESQQQRIDGKRIQLYVEP